MCIGCIVDLPGRKLTRVGSRGELAKALGLYPNNIPSKGLDGAEIHESPRHCLCWVDFDRLAGVLSCKAQYSPDDDAMILEVVQ